jgi:hypothetical protein
MQFSEGYNRLPRPMQVSLAPLFTAPAAFMAASAMPSKPQITWFLSVVTTFAFTISRL